MFIIPFDDQAILLMDGNKITSKEGTLYGLSPNIKHHEDYVEDIPRYMAIFIDQEMMKEQLSVYNGTEGIEFMGEIVQLQEGLVERIKYFMSEADNVIPGNDLVIRALEVDICHQIIRNLLGISYSNDRVSSRLEVNKAINFMYSNFSSQLSVERIAKEANMSVSHFSRVFKNETGSTVTDYLNKIRIKVVKKLLVKDRLTLTEIAHQSGFNSLSYMSTCFSKYNKILPSQYRDMLRR